MTRRWPLSRLAQDFEINYVSTAKEEEQRNHDDEDTVQLSDEAGLSRGRMNSPKLKPKRSAKPPAARQQQRRSTCITRGCSTTSKTSTLEVEDDSLSFVSSSEHRSKRQKPDVMVKTDVDIDVRGTTGRTDRNGEEEIVGAPVFDLVIIEDPLSRLIKAPIGEVQIAKDSEDRGSHKGYTWVAQAFPSSASYRSLHHSGRHNSPEAPS